MLTLIRGLPGTGKSTLAKRLVAEGKADVHIETDLWFMYVKHGVTLYKFNPDKLSEYHANCLAATKSALEAGQRVIVSNTFSRAWEMQPYLELGYAVTIVELSKEYGSKHASVDVIDRMRDRWEPMAGTKQEIA